MARLDLGSYLEDDAVEILGVPSRAHPTGRTYRFASPDAKTGLRLASLADLAVSANLGRDLGDKAEKLTLDDDEELNLIRDVFGDTLDEMLADGVSWVRIQKLNRYLFIFFAMGAEAAEKGLNAQGEASAPNRAARRTKAKATPSRASTAGKTPRKARAVKAV